MPLPPDPTPQAFPATPGSTEPIPPPVEPDQQIDQTKGLQQESVPRVGLIMGSQSDWETLSHAATMLDTLGISFETRIVSAHRTPDRLAEYAASARPRGIRVIIAGAGGAAHLPGMCAAWTSLPVLGVPMESHALRGMDSLLSIVQMPAGVPVGTLAIGRAGAVNAAILAGSILSLDDSDLATRIETWRALQTASVPDAPSR
jgi:5-(carboxyamino)imidazole ribonucleotide mutase